MFSNTKVGFSKWFESNVQVSWADDGGGQFRTQIPTFETDTNSEQEHRKVVLEYAQSNKFHSQ